MIFHEIGNLNIPAYGNIETTESDSTFIISIFCITLITFVVIPMLYNNKEKLN